jgi:hypothetical protein
MFTVITNIYVYNQKIKGSILMELFTATEELKIFFLTTRDVSMFPLISSDYAENWPEPVQRHLQRLMDDHLISACTDTYFQYIVYTTHKWSCL